MSSSKSKPVRRGKKRPKTRAERADRHRLYQKSVQCVEAEIDFVEKTFRKRRGRRP
ncbi:MAG: class I SAM-dependent methyltransferase, partial [Gammaproteobacteria bacterium]